MKSLKLTPPLLAAIDAVHDAAADYIPGCMSASIVELPKLALADAVLEAVHAQAVARVERLLRLPKAKPAPVAVVELELRRKRRRWTA